MNRLTYMGANGKPYFKRDGCYKGQRLAVDEAAEQLAAYENADEQGLLLRLPCKIGDKLYSLRNGSILVQTVESFTYEGELIAYVSYECDMECDGCPHSHWYSNGDAGDGGCDGEGGIRIVEGSEIGKTVFLSREEAKGKGGEQNEI